MYTTYHLTSAQEANSDILDSIKATFKSKSITIIVETEDDLELTAEMKAILDDRSHEDEQTYLTAEDSINQLNKKYGLKNYNFSQSSEGNRKCDDYYALYGIDALLNFITTLKDAYNILEEKPFSRI